MAGEQVDELAEKWCVENMDCCKMDNNRGEETPYFSDEERCTAKSAYAAGFDEGYKTGLKEQTEKLSDCLSCAFWKEA